MLGLASRMEKRSLVEFIERGHLMIELENITKTIGGKVILDNLSLRIDQGDLVAIVGKSGSGKSTLLNFIRFDRW